ncbi:biotin--[acetyl-CoA-carboxylase] ligase [Campylobacter sp. MIT 97-5078]|uniref:biotin--[acetyl-CoA-carboxylase] ligase n=1 Tax=Campylobacter sp. MIT 97-5078 TaxID=1548153 RepID=UPI000513DA03|nr:biotin--[acetyl-CoA-carboxylase] ligase [Campylobacter sp. MIT 97-5078]KGI56527.1 biotin--protein ligase [Campylobacter sp. MIT 97-5078]TQR27022.1 biotin--[acetyl-CoA-carboxylase] ligase [Campylobacter sp. MIT 97-5078]
MEIICIESIASTHLYMCEAVRNATINKNLAIYALEQTGGIGSRESKWHSTKGNLHLNFCLSLEDLPQDLPLSSVSIYFSFILKELLSEQGSKIWLKWPNDLYIADKKIGGMMSTRIRDFIIVGVGINIKNAPAQAGLLDINLDLKDFIELFIKEIQKKFLWKQIFSKYVIEFEKSKPFSVHHEGKKLPLKEALLYEDGSILLDNKRIYSLR